MGSLQRLPPPPFSQSQSQSTAVDNPQVIDSYEGEASDSEQEVPNSGTLELDQLIYRANGL